MSIISVNQGPWFIQSLATSLKELPSGLKLPLIGCTNNQSIKGYYKVYIKTDQESKEICL